MKKLIFILLLFTSCLAHEKTTQKVVTKGNMVITETTTVTTVVEKTKKTPRVHKKNKGRKNNRPKWTPSYEEKIDSKLFKSK